MSNTHHYFLYSFNKPGTNHWCGGTVLELHQVLPAAISYKKAGFEIDISRVLCTAAQFAEIFAEGVAPVMTLEESDTCVVICLDGVSRRRGTPEFEAYMERKKAEELAEVAFQKAEDARWQAECEAAKDARLAEEFEAREEAEYLALEQLELSFT